MALADAPPDDFVQVLSIGTTATVALAFGEGIGPGDVRLVRSGDNLVMLVGADGDQVTLPDWYYDGYESYRIDRFSFVDGTVLTGAELMALQPPDVPPADLVLRGTAGDDTLVGGAGNDILLGGLGNDSLIGGAGNDTLNAGAGADLLTGGSGNDTYTVDDPGDTVVELADEGTDRILSSIDYTLGANVENLTLTGSESINGTGNDLANTLVGNNAGNILDGRGGNDILIGGLGNDSLIGGEGNDTLNGGAGADLLTGGSGNDTYTVDDPGDMVVELADEGTDRVLSSIDYALGTNVENLTLTGSESINGTGNDLANTRSVTMGAISSTAVVVTIS